MKISFKNIYIKYLFLIFLFLIQFIFFFIFSFKKVQTEDSFKILIVSDIHNNVNKVKALAEKVKSLKFDFIFCSGDIIDKDTMIEKKEAYIKKLKKIFFELEKIGRVIWIPGNHEDASFFNEK